MLYKEICCCCFDCDLSQSQSHSIANHILSPYIDGVDGYVDIIDDDDVVVVIVVVATFVRWCVCYNSCLLFPQKLPGQGSQQVQTRELSRKVR